MGLPGWSIVALLKRIGEPIASMNASRSITPAEQKWLNVPPYIATERGPYSAMMRCRSAAMPVSAASRPIGCNEPVASRRTGCSTRFGSQWNWWKLRPLTQLYP